MIKSSNSDDREYIEYKDFNEQPTTSTQENIFKVEELSYSLTDRNKSIVLKNLEYKIITINLVDSKYILEPVEEEYTFQEVTTEETGIPSSATPPATGLKLMFNKNLNTVVVKNVSGQAAQLGVRKGDLMKKINGIEVAVLFNSQEVAKDLNITSSVADKTPIFKEIQKLLDKLPRPFKVTFATPVSAGSEAIPLQNNSVKFESIKDYKVLYDYTKIDYIDKYIAVIDDQPWRILSKIIDTKIDILKTNVHEIIDVEGNTEICDFDNKSYTIKNQENYTLKVIMKVILYSKINLENFGQFYEILNDNELIHCGKDYFYHFQMFFFRNQLKN